jgi:rRNA-processing protein FCF1
MLALLDTNALMTAEQFNIDIFSELARLGYVDLLVPSPVLEELKWLAAHADKGRDKIAARVGLGLAARCRTVEAPEDADSALHRLAVETGAAVYTNDKELKKRLFSSGISVIYLRQSRYLEIAMQKEF